MDNKGIIIQPPQKRTIAEAIAADYDFNIGDTIVAAFVASKGLKLKFFLALLIYISAAAVLGTIDVLLFGDDTNRPYDIVTRILMSLISAGFTAMGLNWLRSSNTDITDFFSGFKIPASIILASLTMYLLVFIGALLLIIPGIYLFISYTFIYYIIFDNPNIKIWDSLETSRKIIHKQWFKMFALNLIFALIFLVALIPFLITFFGFEYFDFITSETILGLTLLVAIIPFILCLIWTLPAFFLANGIIYRQIFDINNVASINEKENTNNEYNQNIS